MDYEKKYKEAFALMKDCIPDENGLVHVRPDDIFPELKESEDERIRKEMISWLKGFIGEEEGCGYTEDEIKERIAWLEKQGEQKPYGQREECLDCQMNYAGECKGSCAMKRDEPKPADTEKGAKGNEREIPNSAWSEEDESMLYGVMETEQYMLDVVNGEKTFDVGNEQIESQCTKELAWLKILKDRYTWKPSDEQMNALNYVVNLMASSERPTENDLYYNILKSLRQQLKKHYL